MLRFREDYPAGHNVLVCSDPHLFSPRARKGLAVTAVGITEFRRWYEEQLPRRS